MGGGEESRLRLDADRLTDVEANGHGRALMANNAKIVDATSAVTMSLVWLSSEFKSRSLLSILISWERIESVLRGLAI